MKKKKQIIIIIILLFLVFILIQVIGNMNFKMKYEFVTSKLTHTANFLRNESNTEGNTYYIAMNGTSNEGLDKNNPMCLEEAKKKTYTSNDRILFKAGDIFYGILNFNVNNDNGYIYIGSYGEGEKPIISGANILINAEAWEIENGLYRIDLSNYNNFYGIGETTWEPFNIAFLEDEKGKIYGNRKKSIEDIENNFDFVCIENFLYIKSEKNPSELLGKIKFIMRVDLVKISSNMIIENLNIQDAGGHGISKKYSYIENVYINNCIIQNIGGCQQTENYFPRYGNGIEFWNQAKNTLIENCIIRNIYDAAYTIQGDTDIEGFENNVFRNNILINCTYDEEVWSYDKNQKDKKSKIIGYVSEENVSINQGNGWGYDSGTRREPASTLVFWDNDTLPDNTQMVRRNNTYYNFRNLYYTYNEYNNGITKDKFKKVLDSENNKLYMTDSSTFLCGQGNFYDRTILDEYEQEKNAKFYLLSDNDLKKVLNDDILNSNDYSKIKTYYENLENEFEYTEKVKPIIEQYTNFEEKYLKEMEDFREIQKNINNIRQNIQNTTISTDITYIIQQLEQTYKIGIEIINTNISNKEDMLIDIEKIGRAYKNIIDLKNEYVKVDFGNIESQIKLLTEQLNDNLDLNIQKLSNLEELALEYYNKISDNQNYVDQYNYISSKYLIEYVNILLNSKITEYIETNPITVSYSETKLTNKDVIATLNIGSDAKVTNNEGNNTYTFKENGSFSFEYERRGRTFSQEVKVENIDKILPEISNIENGKIYFESVIPNVNDEHLGKVQVTLNGQAIEGYSLGNELTEEGQYELVATDKAGNVTKVVFYIFLNDENGYQIKDNNIMNIYPETTVKEFKEAFTLLKEYVIKNVDKELTEEDNIATGNVLEDDEGKIFTLIVLGDLNQDGKLSLSDISLERKYILKMIDLSEVQRLATDVNFDDNISLTDISIMRKLVLEMK